MKMMAKLCKKVINIECAEMKSKRERERGRIDDQYSMEMISIPIIFIEGEEQQQQGNDCIEMF